MSRFRWWRKLRGGVWYARYYSLGGGVETVSGWERLHPETLDIMIYQPAWCEDWRPLEEQTLWRLSSRD